MTAERRRTVWAALLLAGAVVAVYGQVYGHGFVELDDPGYVSENPFVQRGLTWDGIRWAFTTGHMWHWSPLTWLSYMLDVQLFGLHAGAHHLVNLALHMANTLLLLALLQRMTRTLWPSLIVAALFALHPLHVESVAWISERKDVLSTVFFFLTLWVYVSYVESGSWRSYATCLVLFALGLMAKAMLVTVPFVLLLLDVWPLERSFWFLVSGSWLPARDRKPRTGNQGPGTRNQKPSFLLAEKLPFFVLTVLFCVITYVTQRANGAMDETGALPVTLRVANALVAYVRYLAMAVWPANLAVFYPYDMSLPMWQAVLAALCIAVISVVVLRSGRHHPYAVVGWLWYLGTLVPVIGLVQVGSQALADRYTYVPLIGVFVILAWGGRDLVARWAVPIPLVATMVTSVIVAYAVVAWVQVGLWRTGETLLAHAVRVTRGNYLAHNNLGVALAAQGKTDAAIEQYREALRLNPDYEHARSNLGNALLARYQQALSSNPNDPVAHYDMATALRDSGRLQEASEQYTEALRLEPDYASACKDLGVVLVELGQFQEAIAQLEHAARLTPNDATLHFNLGSTMARAGHLAEAVEQYRRVLALTPDDAEAWGNLAMAYAGLRQTSAATDAQRKAVALARSQGQWALVKTLEDWLSAYRASRDGSGPAS